MPTPEDEGGMCLICGQMYFGEDHDHHQKKLNPIRGDRFKMEMKGLTVTAEVLEENSDRTDEAPHGYVMYEIEKIEKDGEDVTEELIEKSFDGESTRGIPKKMICETEMEVLNP